MTMKEKEKRKKKKPLAPGEEPKKKAALRKPSTDSKRKLAEPDEEKSDALAVVAGESASIDQIAPQELGAPSTEAIEEEEEQAAAQLGSTRYVLAGFFAAGMIVAFVIGKIIHGVWSAVSNRDWFVNHLPRLAAVSDDEKTTIGMVIGGIVALVFVLRTYRKPEVRSWTDEVAAELNKVKWPTKKDVTNNTVVVIAASAVATVYLALLDRLWAFITNLVYGTGS